MLKNITSPFLGMHFSLEKQDEFALLTIKECDDDILPALVKIELALAEQSSVKKIKLFYAEHLKTAIIKRLLKLNYYEQSDHYLKEITYRKSVRFSITEKCNYRCFFCHEEGMEMEVRRKKGQHQQFFDVIKQVADLGYDDFTFTGGEPLLNWIGVDACLTYMEEINYFPEITIVTNGEKINQPMLDRLKRFPGMVRFNLSLHSLIDKEYLEIVHRKKKENAGQDDLLTKIKANMKLIHDAAIPFKLNIVLLKDINTSKKSLDAILSYAAQCGAMSVKFLELLITESLKDFYPYFYTLSAVKNSLNDDLTLLWQNQKKDVYQYKDSQLEVELQHCPCARGCNACLLNTSVTFTAEMKLFPCFLNPQDYLLLEDNNLTENIDKGDKYIDGMAKYYQDSSPILIQEHYSTHQEVAYYYQINKDQIERVTRLLNGKLVRVRNFSETYFLHDDLKSNEYRKITKNSYDETALEVAQKVNVLEDNAYQTIFLHDGIEIHDLNKHTNLMIQNGFTQASTFHWEIEFFTAENKDQYTISKNNETGLYLLRSNQPIQEITLNLNAVVQPIHALLSSK